MVADHWFQLVEKVLEVLAITSNATRIRLAAFQLEGESQVWWDWIKTSRNLEAMTWGDFCMLLMNKFFLGSARHDKAWEFLELRQRVMTVLKYVAKFTELARFANDYMATYIAKVRKFEDGLKLFIWGKNVGLLLHDMDFMVRTTMTIERKIDDAKSIQDANVNKKRKENQFSSGSGKKRRTSSPRGCPGQGHGYQGQGQDQLTQDRRPFRAPSQPGQRVCFQCHQPGHMRLDCP